jgi:hypothetical protein
MEKVQKPDPMTMGGDLPDSNIAVGIPVHQNQSSFSGVN